jgi:integrase/recombinase XerD
MTANAKRSVDPLTREEIKEILESAIVNSRDYLILRLLARTGIRIGELYGVYNKEHGEWIHGLQKKDIDFRNKSLWVYVVKRKKTTKRQVEVDNVIINMLREYTKTMTPEDYVFRKTISYNTITQLPRKYARHAGIEKKVSCRSFRHFFITNLWEEGKDIQYIQYLAGHRDIGTTLLYTRPQNNHLSQNRVI